MASLFEGFIGFFTKQAPHAAKSMKMSVEWTGEFDNRPHRVIDTGLSDPPARGDPPNRGERAETIEPAPGEVFVEALQSPEGIGTLGSRIFVAAAVVASGTPG